MKKKLFIAIACSAMVVACHNAPKNLNPGGFTIVGTVKGLDSGWVYFGHSDSTGFHSDSIHVKGGQFNYMGKVSEPSQYYFWMKGLNGKDMDPVDFFVDDTVIQMNVDKDSVKKSTISGSPTEEQYMQYKDASRPVKEKMQALNKAYTMAASKGDEAAMKDLDKQYSQLEKEEQDAVVSFISKNPSSVIGAWYVERNMLYDVDVKVVKPLFDKFSSAVQQTKYGKTIKKILDIQEHLQVGMMAPDFTQNDTAGKPVSLASYKGKYVLLDFWASWCGPCRRENPNVVAAYEKYKDKNFTVLGVSLDDSKTAWLRAIADDHLAWNQVSDLKGFQNSAATQFGIMAIPSNYLIDPEGKILGHNLRGDDLENKLAEVIK